jgi:hypothetical protein
MEEQNNPLEYLDNLLFFDGISQLMSTYLGNKEILEEGYFFHSDDQTYVRMDLIETPDGENSDIIATIITRNDFLTKYLDSYKHNLFNHLKGNEQDNNFSVELKTIYNSLNKYIKKTLEIENKYKDILESHIISLIKDLKVLFPIIETHIVFRYLKQNEGFISYFQFKDIKASFFEALYETTYKLDLIDDIEVLEETFYDVLTASRPNPNQKIIFNSKNHLIAHYLKEIEPFFNNLNSSTIEKSKCFYNKQGKLLTSTDLYTSLSRNKNNNLEYIKKITYQIHILQKAYLR